MKMLGQKDYEEVRVWMHRNARSLELSIWNYFFEGGQKSPLYHGNEDIVATELDYLVDTRNAGGVWDITWTWFALGEKYPKEFAVSENWWKAGKAIEKMKFLRNFGRIG